MAWRPKTRQEFARILNIEVVPVFGDLKPDEVKRGEVRALVDRLAERAPIMANRVFEVTRRLYTWAIGKDLVETSPCIGLSKPSAETARDRVLTEDEIRAFWTACDGEDGVIADAFRLMLITAQRRGEVLSMRWQDIEGTWWTIPADVTKNGRSHRVPLSPQAVTILEKLRRDAQELGCSLRPRLTERSRTRRKPASAYGNDRRFRAYGFTISAGRRRRS